MSSRVLLWARFLCSRGLGYTHPLFLEYAKYADDSYLLVGSNHIASASEEFKRITIWARENNLRLNPSKTKELIVFKSRIRHILPPAKRDGAGSVSSLRVLGVVISSDLGISAHLDQVLSSCASSMYALRVLRSSFHSEFKHKL